jgi:hypothetical protein
VARLSCLCSFHNGLPFPSKILRLAHLSLLQLAYHLGCNVEGVAPSMLADSWRSTPVSRPLSLELSYFRAPLPVFFRNVTYNIQWKVISTSYRQKNTLIESIIIARLIKSAIMEFRSIYTDYV